MNNAKVAHTQLMLQCTYALAPILLGLDKLHLYYIVDWTKYVSPVLMTYIPVTVMNLLVLVGIIEIAVGLLVWFRPRMGAYLVAAWMCVIILNLISMHAFYDIIARDMIIAVGALALAWLSEAKVK